MDSEKKSTRLSMRNNQFRIKVVEDEEEWFQVRKCLARAFYDYPLYRYLILKSKTREQFLTKFLEANYDVAVRRSNAVVLSISKTTGSSCIVIGGCFFVPPDQNGGWGNAENQDLLKMYFDCYVKHGMGEIDNEALQNMISYEKWESECVFEKIKTRTFNSWLAYFWGIDPEYSGRGYGSATYPYIKRELAKVHRKMFYHDETSNADSLAKTHNNAPSRTMSRYEVDDTSLSSKPTISGLCHCERAKRFHERHGFRTLMTFPLLRGVLDRVDENTENLELRVRFILLDLNEDRSNF